jgi:ribosomal protein S18 acetylase RimI-like enzyme
MRIRPLLPKDRERLHAILRETLLFNPEEIRVAMELIDIVLSDRGQEDYEIECMADENDRAIGYVCYGPAPMTQGTYDLYWIAVHPGAQGRRIGSRLINFLEEAVQAQGGRMILVETSSTPDYEKTLEFYVRNGFREQARVPDYYHPGNDRITFCKRL